MCFMSSTIPEGVMLRHDSIQQKCAIYIIIIGHNMEYLGFRM